MVCFGVKNPGRSNVGNKYAAGEVEPMFVLVDDCGGRTKFHIRLGWLYTVGHALFGQRFFYRPRMRRRKMPLYVYDAKGTSTQEMGL